MKLLIAGDFFVADGFAHKDLIDKAIVDVFKSADLSLINQEAPITLDVARHRINKTGPHLQSSASTTIPYLKQLGVGVATLANNHIFDYGANGLVDTFSSLMNENISFVGAGLNKIQATAYFSFIKNDVKVAIINIAENEWSTTTEDRAGANPLDIVDNVKQIRSAKETHDKVICIIHGGHEYYKLPSLRMQKQYRFYIDSGADAIVGHHTHCISGYEIYKDAPIIYSLGNFLFTMQSSHEEWYQGLLVGLLINREGPVGFELIPIEQCRKSFRVTVSDELRKEAVNQDVEYLSTVISEEALLKAEWNKFVSSRKDNYRNYLSPLAGIHNRYIKYLMHYLKLNSLFSSHRKNRLILNIIRCEAHRDLMLASLDDQGA